MGKDSKTTCKVASHHLLKDKAKNRVEDLQLMFTDIQFARKESRAGDVALLEEQVNQILREWKAELNEPTPASSLHEDGLGSFSSELGRLLKEIEEEDDAISPLKHGPEIHGSKAGEMDVFKEGDHFNCTAKEAEFQGFQQFQGSASSFHNTTTTNLEPSAFLHSLTTNLEASNFQHNTSHLEASNFQHNTSHFEAPNFQHSTSHLEAPNFQHSTSHLEAPNFQHSASHLEVPNFHRTSDNDLEMLTHADYFQFNQDEICICPSNVEQCGADGYTDVSGMLISIHPSPSAFLGPKCALWDCPRPVQGSEWCQHYCSAFHAKLAAKEGPPGMAPVLRPGGIGLKDGPLFSALRAKIEGKDVGIPECEGVATSRSPWNAPELFDISFIEGETIREWLFFDKPRRAFECGNRKQRSLPDHNGRGWHESRKQVMKEFGGWKRSYYMDPQPLNECHWHLFEYEIENCNGCALYRLELKLVDGKKSPKKKVTKDSLADLQNRLGRLTADAPTDNKSTGRGKAKGNIKPEPGSVVPPSAIAGSSSIVLQGSGVAPESHLTGDSTDCYDK